MEIWDEAKQVREYKHEQKQLILRAAHALAQKNQLLFDYVRSTLSVLALVPEIRKIGHPACASLLAEAAGNIPGALIAARLDRSGTMVCANRPDAVGVSLADRAYVQQALATGRLAISGFQKGRVTKRPTVAMAAPIFDEAGTVTGLTLLSLDLTTLSSLHNQMNVLPGSTVTLIDTEGRILFATPDEHGLTGQLLKDHPLTMAALADTSGVSSTIGYDGQPWLAGHAEIGPTLAARLIVSMPERSLHAAILERVFREALWLLLAFTAGSTVIIVIVRNSIIGPILTMVAAVRQFTRTSQPVTLPAGSHTRELTELSTAISVMMQALGRQDAELRQRQHELEQVNHLLGDVIDAASDWFWEMGPDLRFTFISSNLETLLGVPASYFLGNSRRQLLSPEGWTRENSQHIRDLEDHKPFRNVRIRYVLPDGRARIVQSSGKPLFDAAGTFLGYRGSSSDVTAQADREQAMARLAEENAGLAEVVRQMSSGVVITDPRRPDNPVVFVNPAITRLTGYAADEVIGRNCRFFHAGHDRQPGLDSLRAAIRHRIHAKVILENTRKDGTRFWNEIHISPVFDQNGELVAFAGIQTDITAQVEAERQRHEQERRLRQGQKLEALGTLAGGIAHDFNNILVPIIGMSQLVRRRLPADSQERTNLDIVLAAANRARALVRQILAFSRQEPESLELLDLRTTVQEAIGLLRSTLPATITLHDHIVPTPIPVLGNSTHLHQVLVNLCTNAAQAIGKAKGQITIRLYEYPTPLEGTGTAEGTDAKQPGKPSRPSRRQAVIEVQDDGCGMAETTLARIFDPFFTTKGVGEGTGLGLAMVHGIVQSHDGTIEVESHVGSGSLFRISLPIAEPTEQQEHATEQAKEKSSCPES